MAIVISATRCYLRGEMGRTSDARQRLMEAATSLICEYSYGTVTVDGFASGRR